MIDATHVLPERRERRSPIAPSRREPAYAALDAALESLAVTGPDLANGMANHAPMTVEALCALGRANAVPAWITRYRPATLPWPAARAPIAPDAWRAALGRMDRVADWRALFIEELRGLPWDVVLDRWVARLTPGMCSNAAHGIIRVGHATRALADAATPARLSELADGFATWAASYQELPTALTQNGQTRPAGAALARVAIVPSERRRFSGTIVSALEGLDEWPDFAPVVGWLDVSGDPACVLGELTELFTHVYLANAADFLRTIVLIHGVTSLAALGHALPYLRPATAREAVRFAWQTSCALYATFGSGPPTERTLAAPAESTTTLANMAVAHSDEHAIKFTEACLSQYAVNPSPVFLAAARHALDLLPRS